MRVIFTFRLIVADFNYFFDSMGRKRCYLGPERFISGHEQYGKESKYSKLNFPSSSSFSAGPDEEDLHTPLESSMDVYSLGCTIGEIFLNEPFIDLPDALKYVNAPPNITDLEEGGSVILNRIGDVDIKKLVCHMTRRDSTKRKSVKAYREEMELSGSFPPYFSGVLYVFFLKLHLEGNNPDDRIKMIANNFGDLITGMDCTALLEVDFVKLQNLLVTIFDYSSNSSNVLSGQEKVFLGNTDCNSIDKYTTIVDFLERYCESKEMMSSNSISQIELHENKFLSTSPSISKIFDEHHPMQYDPLAIGKYLIEWLENEKKSTDSTSVINGPGGLLLIIQVICSNIRHLRCPHAKIVATLLLICFGRCSDDDVILQRVLPFIMIMVEDPISSVKATAVRACRSLIRMVTKFSSLQSNLFQFYIFPALGRISKDTDAMVRVAFAECIGHFAEVSKTFLDKQQMLHTKKLTREEINKDASSVLGQELHSFFYNKNEMDELFHGSYAMFVESSYDIRFKSLQDQVSRWIRELMLDSSNVESRKGSGLASQNSIIKRALLTDIVRLCVFFGHGSTMDILIPQLLTFLNDQDWELRYALCAKMTSVCTFVGPIVTSECIIPCIEMAMYDVEDMVVCRAISCLSSLVQLSLLPVPIAISVVHGASPLLLHPSRIIQFEVIRLTALTAKYIGEVDSCVFILPLLSKCTDCNLMGAKLTEKCIYNSLKPRLSRSLYRIVLHGRLNYASAIDGTSHMKNGVDAWIGDSTSDWLGDNNRHYEDPYWGRDRASISDIYDSKVASSSYFDRYEDEKLKFIIPYIESAAREICTKTMQWKNGLSTGVSTAAGVAATIRRNLALKSSQDFDSYQSPLPSTNLEGLLEISMNLFPEPSSLFIPSQKLGLLRSPSNQKDSFELNRHDEDAFAISNSYAVSRSLETARLNLISPVSNEDFSSAMKLQSEQFSTEEIGVTIRRIRTMNIPPLSPNFGPLCQPDGRPYSMYTEALDMSNQQDHRSQWRPRENVLVASLWEHKKSVNKLAVSRDQSFFASASSDKSVKIWQVNSLDDAAFLKSSITYEEHQKPVIDLCVVENSHTIASASMNGSIHLWRVDHYKQRIGNVNGMASALDNRHQNHHGSILGSTVLKTIDVEEGQLLNINHFNSDSASILLYTTQKGYIHAWDLRNNMEPFVITVRPELGTPTCLALAPDRCWIMVGTNRGYIGLWDIRYNVLCKLWRHSSTAPIHRMACCKPIPKTRSDIMQFTGGSYLFVAAGNNEAAVWGIPEGGECYRCFRSLSMADAYRRIESLPVLQEIPLSSHPNGIIAHALSSLRSENSLNTVNLVHSVRAIMGRISHTGLSYLITAGTDKNIRFWDFMAPNRYV